MIALANGYLRAADADDAALFHRLYRVEKPRAALLDKAREPLLPTRDELALMLAKKEHFKGGLHVLDDPTGEPRGFCALRGLVHDARYAELSLLFFEDADYDSALADDALAYVRREAFTRYSMYKVVTQCLDSETAWAGFLASRGFEQTGNQRDTLFAGGKWHNLLTYCLYNPLGDAVFASVYTSDSQA